MITDDTRVALEYFAPEIATLLGALFFIFVWPRLGPRTKHVIGRAFQILLTLMIVGAFVWGIVDDTPMTDAEKRSIGP